MEQRMAEQREEKQLPGAQARVASDRWCWRHWRLPAHSGCSAHSGRSGRSHSLEAPAQTHRSQTSLPALAAPPFALVALVALVARLRADIPCAPPSLAISHCFVVATPSPQRRLCHALIHYKYNQYKRDPMHAQPGAGKNIYFSTDGRGAAQYPQHALPPVGGFISAVASSGPSGE